MLQQRSHMLQLLRSLQPKKYFKKTFRVWTFPWHCLDIHVVREIAVLVLGKWIFGSGFAQQSTTSGPPWGYSLLLTQQSWNQVFTIASVRATVLKAFACMLAMEWKVLKKEGPGMYEQWFMGET